MGGKAEIWVKTIAKVGRNNTKRARFLALLQWARQDSNLWPHGCEPCAQNSLSLSARIADLRNHALSDIPIHAHIVWGQYPTYFTLAKQKTAPVPFPYGRKSQKWSFCSHSHRYLTKSIRVKHTIHARSDRFSSHLCVLFSTKIQNWPCRDICLHCALHILLISLFKDRYESSTPVLITMSNVLWKMIPKRYFRTK